MSFDMTACIEAWRTQLLDTTRRNRLINFKTGRGGGILLLHPDPGDLWDRLLGGSALTFARRRDLLDLPEPPPDADDSLTLPIHDEDTPETPVAVDELKRCLESPRLRDSHLLTDRAEDRLRQRLTRLALGARESLSEQGVATLYVCFGFLRWFESSDSDVEVRSPLLLVPVKLERDSIESPWRLRAADDELLTNHSLAQLLLEDFKLHLPRIEDGAHADEKGWRTDYLSEVQKCIRDLPRWEVLDEVALGMFSFQKLAMWEDLGRNRDRIAGHDLCRAIAGDPLVSLRVPPDLPSPEDLDSRTRPHDTHHILDTDSSQHAAIVAATRGASLVLDGPPGTGKSQTIANVIAEFLAVGKTVLFVSEKTAALEVVKRRLDDRRLGDFCLEVHSHKANKRGVIAELGRCLDLAPPADRDPGDVVDRLVEEREYLNAYVRELHVVRQPLGLSVFQAHGQLAELADLTSRSRCPVPGILERDAAFLRHQTDLLAGLPDCRGYVEQHDRHPWRKCKAVQFSLTLPDEVRHHFTRLADAVGEMAGAAEALHELGLTAKDPTLADWQEEQKKVREILECPLAPASWFQAGEGGCSPVEAAAAAVRLDETTRRCQHLREVLPEFDPKKVWQAEPAAWDELKAVAEGVRSRLRPHSDRTTRALRQRLARVAANLRRLHEEALAVGQAVQRVADLLRVPLPPLAVRELNQFADTASRLARIGPVRRAWWDPGRRLELQRAVTRHREESHSAAGLRVDLMDRLSPPAFVPGSAATAARPVRVPWFLARLLPRSWAVRDEVLSWYTHEPPKLAALREDMRKLTTYHRCLEFCRQVQAQYAAEMLPGPGGEADWEGTLEALRALDRLGQRGKVPPELQDALSSEDGLDRPALAFAAAELVRQVASLRQAVEACGLDHDLGPVLEPPQKGDIHHFGDQNDECPLFRAQAALAGRETVALDHLCALLAEGRDIPLADLPARARSLVELGALRARAAQDRIRLGLKEPPEEIEDRDWSKFRAQAEALLRYLSGRGSDDPLSSAVVQALTSIPVRERIAEILRRSEAADGEEFAAGRRFLNGLFDPVDDVSTGIVLDRTPLGELRRWLSERAADAERVLEWTRFSEVRQEMSAAGVGPILDELLAGKVKLEEAVDAFRVRFLRLWLDAVCEQVPVLRQFKADEHERHIARFVELDRLAITSEPGRLRRALLTRADRPTTDAEAPETSELGILLREVHKKVRHRPLRRLFTDIPTLLLRLKPCLMMSPLAVSTYLESPDIRFDLVIFDEASQVRPHDAICAIYRGKQLVVAGDQKQLPPTNFFERALAESDAIDEGDGLSDFESILDVCCTLGLPRRRLRWHYRSRRELLIAFANHHVYDNELVTFPSVHDVNGDRAVVFEPVADGRWKVGVSGGYNAVEARHVAELVLRHFRENPKQSLGVIAFSLRQQMRILDELERLRRADPKLEEFFQEDRDDPFFVKNLENVQGDERDVVFLSVGYGPDETGRVAMRFGPLNRSGGERRLNVAVTRARERMVVVSSMRAQDVDLSRTSAVGARMLRDFLDYAERGPVALGERIREDSNRDFESPFEREVAEELEREGLTVHRQVGCGGFRVDLAIVDAAAPGRYLLGIECDGASYHSSATARDRDRLRQEVLEKLGWQLCRVWSTDWVRDRRGQVKKVKAALARARRDRDAGSPEASPMPHEDPTEKPPEETVPTPVEQPAAFDFPTIDEVPEDTLREVLLGTLRRYGATESAELIASTARQLGFKRTGPRIQARAEECLEELLREEKVCRTADGRLQAVFETESLFQKPALREGEAPAEPVFPAACGSAGASPSPSGTETDSSKREGVVEQRPGG